MRKFLLLGILLLMSIAFTYLAQGKVYPTQQPWVDPNQIRGRLLSSAEVYQMYGVAFDGKYRDPDGNAVVFSIDGPADATRVIDPNSGVWSVLWYPATNTIGQVVYFVIQASSVPEDGGKTLTDIGTLAVKVLPADRPPEIGFTGCRIVNPK